MTDGPGRYDEQMRDAVEGRDALTALLASRGWEIFNEWLQQEVDIQRRQYEEEAPQEVTDLHKAGWQRGRLSTLRTLQDMPRRLLDSHQQAIDQVELVTGGHDGEQD